MNIIQKIAQEILDTQPTFKTLFENKWVALKEMACPAQGINGYDFLHETRCNGKIISILPFRKIGDDSEYLIRKEVTPCWSLDPEHSSITGGDEGNVIESAIRELEEEAGFDIEEKDLIDLGTCYGTKSTDTVYYLFSTDLTGKEMHQPKGDGSKLEAEASNEWVKYDFLLTVKDPLVSTICLRLQKNRGNL